MSQRYQGGILGVGFNPLQAPDAPTSVTASSLAATTASVAFTAPANVGGSAVTSYVVLSSPGCITATGASSPIAFSGLTTGTAYTFRVTALNSYGPSPAAASNSVTPVATSQTAYTTAGTYSFVVPTNVTSISVVSVGAGGGGGGTNGACSRGGGGGGALAYTNNISTTPGETLTVTVGTGGPGGANGANGTAGGESALQRSATYLVRAGGGGGGVATLSTPTCGGIVLVGTGGAGGAGASAVGANGTGGGGAGGYSGAGGAGSNTTAGSAAATSSGGGGGGATGNISSLGGGGGGGVGILGIGATGTGGVATGGGGVGGSGGANGTTSTTDAGAAGGAYGGGGGGSNDDGNAGAAGGGGAVRIIWSGTARSFPSTNTGDL
jgi:hypothetical protein